MNEVALKNDLPATVDQNQPTDLVLAAIEKGMSPEIIERLLDQKLRFEADEARKAYYVAVAAFKADPPAVYKDKLNVQYKNAYQPKGSGYVSIENLVNTVNKSLAEHQLSAHWDFSQDGDLFKVTCILSHIKGHSESVSISAPPDDSGSKNTLQQIKSTQTYLKIMTFEAVTGVASEAANINADGNRQTTTEAPEPPAELVTKIKATKTVKELGAIWKELSPSDRTLATRVTNEQKAFLEEVVA